MLLVTAYYSNEYITIILDRNVGYIKDANIYMKYYTIYDNYNTPKILTLHFPYEHLYTIFLSMHSFVKLKPLHDQYWWTF